MGMENVDVDAPFSMVVHVILMVDVYGMEVPEDPNKEVPVPVDEVVEIERIDEDPVSFVKMDVDEDLYDVLGTIH